MSRPLDLLLITVDCLRADCFRGDTWPRTLERMEGGAVYASAYANGCGTPDSFPALLASRHSRPFAGSAECDPDAEYALKPEDVTLAEALRAGGYGTAAFIAGNPYLGRRYGYDRGFDLFLDHQPAALVDRLTGGRLRGAMRAMAPHLPWSPYPEAATVTERARSHIEQASANGSRPSFVWAHYMDAHVPTLPPGRRSLADRRAAWAPMRGDPARHHDRLVALHEDSLRYVDFEVDRLLGAISRPTLMAFTSDHGQLFGEHGSYWHNGVWEELLRVPLVLFGEGVEPVEHDDDVQLLDLPAQLLSLLGQPRPPQWGGDELRRPDDGIYAISNNPQGGTFAEARIFLDRKTIRTPLRSETFGRGDEPERLAA